MTKNALLLIGGVLTLGVIPVLYRLARPRLSRRPRLSTVLSQEFDTELRNWRSAA